MYNYLEFRREDGKRVEKYFVEELEELLVRAKKVAIETPKHLGPIQIVLVTEVELFSDNL